MALKKSVTLPGTPYTASYWSIGRVCRIDEEQRDAEIVLNLYPDADHAETPIWREAARVRFRGAAFDAYFSKAAIAAAGVNAYAGIYRAINDATAAFKAKSVDATLTAEQAVLVAPGSVDIASDFGGVLVFDGAVAA